MKDLPTARNFLSRRDALVSCQLQTSSFVFASEAPTSEENGEDERSSDLIMATSRERARASSRNDNDDGGDEAALKAETTGLNADTIVKGACAGT